MKKLSVTLYFSFFTLLIFAQNITSNTLFYEISNPTGLDKIFLFGNINGVTLLEYNGGATTIKWYKLQNGAQTEISNVNYISPENNTGYILEADGKTTSFWVFDYSQYLPVFYSIAASDSDTPCEKVKIDIQADIPTFDYQNTAGGNLHLDRKFTLTYTNLEWSDNDKKWNEIEVKKTIVLPVTTDIFANAPYTHTAFTLSGDEFAAQLEVNTTPVTSNLYRAKAVGCNISSITSTVRKDIANENNAPSSETQLEGSAPIDIHFYSNPTPAADTYIWKIYKDNTTTPFIARSAQDNTYTFAEAGKYRVEVTASNQYCSSTDTVFVEVTNSSLVVPKIFTPNGDNVQDEFRVAYESIIEFNATVVNRWGRKVFSWSNPAKGWDGKIGGKQAAEGPYYYIITAKGSDGKKYKLKGCINLLR